MELIDYIKKTIEESKKIHAYSIPLLINNAKEQGYTEEQTLEAIEVIMKKGDAYKIPESICLI
jgi:hypothetical protein